MSSSSSSSTNDIQSNHSDLMDPSSNGQHQMAKWKMEAATFGESVALSQDQKPFGLQQDQKPSFVDFQQPNALFDSKQLHAAGYSGGGLYQHHQAVSGASPYPPPPAAFYSAFSSPNAATQSAATANMYSNSNPAANNHQFLYAGQPSSSPESECEIRKR